VVIDGRLRTSRLRQINVGMEEFVAHSFYEDWEEQPLKEAPDGAP